MLSGVENRNFSATRLGFEVAVTFGLIELALWTPRPVQDWISWAALAWILGSSFLVPANRNAVELGISGFKRSLWIIPTALGLAALEILVARHEQTLHLPFGYDLSRYRVWGYVIWSFLQQFILQDYFLLRFLRIFGRRAPAIVSAAGLFAFAHMPNPVLVLATLVWGLVACWLFLRYRDLYSLGFAHAIFGLSIAICVPAALHHNMRVGLGYLRYHPHAHRLQAQRNHIPQIVSTDACVMADAAIRRSCLQARP